MFFAEVLFIGAIGSVIGVVAGTAVSVFFAKNFILLRNVSVDLHVLERILISLASFAAGTGLCAVGALGPVNRLKKLEPILAIKKE
jgi:ABC-type antimicrobial peptide transport system permease subunit